MTLWLVFGAMLLAASIAAAWPFYRLHRRLSAATVVIVIAVVSLSVIVYSELGTPVDTSGPPAVASVDEMVRSLDARLQENPDDLAGWKMLARSYMQLENLPKAIAAFEHAVALEASGNADTLISLGEAVFMNDRSSITGRAGQLFEGAIALAPDNPKALFFGGLAAAQRGDIDLAADRWETLLAVGPPQEIEGVLRQRVAEWRGEPVVTAGPASAGTGEATAVVSVDIGIGEIAAAAINPSSTVFVIARDPAQPSPPLAVTRRMANELPAVVTISDSDAMVPGRVPSAYDQLEIIVRVSATGQPIAQPGDWFGQGVLQVDQGQSITITIDRQVQ